MPQTTSVQVTVPETLRNKCHRPEVPANNEVSIGELASFSILQEAAIETCDVRREALVTLVDTINDMNKTEPRPWWRFW